MLRQRKISASELLEAHLRQISRVNPLINGFTFVREDEARAEALRADQTCHDPALPLRGIPITVKDSLDFAGLPTAAGSKTRAGLRVAHDAPAVARLRSAGAIVIGKTNTPELVASYETDNFVTGRTNNPWNAECTPGGSSGGEAAVIAAFCSAGGVASDGGGSIRVPAHFCGLAGLKPTPGRTPARGHFPVIGMPAGFVTNIGPMARTVQDVRMLYEVMAGYDPGDVFSIPQSVAEPGAVPCRIGVWPAFYDGPVQEDIAVAVSRAATLLNAEPFQPAGLETAPNIWAFLFSALPAAAWRSQLEGRIGEMHWTAAETIGKSLEAPPATIDDLMKNFAARDRMRARLLRQMEEVPVILSPVCGTVAFPHRARRFVLATTDKTFGVFQAMMPSVIWNALGFPALTIPMAISQQGLPIGVQLIGRPWEEQTLLALGERLEQLRGPLPTPPNV